MLKNTKFIIIFFFLFTNSLLAENKLDIRFIDLNFIINNSIMGEKIKNNLKDNNQKILDEFKVIEKDLEKKKKELLSQKNILEKKEFDKKVSLHQKNVKTYNDKRNKVFKKINSNRLIMQNKLLKKIDEILLDYVDEKKIDMIIKKESLIISNSSLDITKNILENLNKKYKNID